VGRMRPLDLERYRAEHPGLFTTAGDSRVTFLVATQTVEVGVDIDLAALVTELASGSAIAQRAGRVNRLGLQESGPITIVMPSGEIADQPPYTAADLQAAAQWLKRRQEDPCGLAAWSIATNQPPPQTMGRLVVSEIQPADWTYLAETSSPHFAEP